MLSRVQLRMARAALNWSLRDLAERAGVNLNTISRYEAGGEMLTATLQKIENVLKAEGILLVEEDEHTGAGVRFSRPSVHSSKRTKQAKKSGK